MGTMMETVLRAAGVIKVLIGTLESAGLRTLVICSVIDIGSLLSNRVVTRLPVIEAYLNEFPTWKKVVLRWAGKHSFALLGEPT